MTMDILTAHQQFKKQQQRGQLEPDYTDAFGAWKQTPTPQTRGALVKKMQPIIDTALRSYVGEASPTMRTQAKLMAAKALDTYDPSIGSLRTHMLSQLQSLQRMATKSQQIISMPQRAALAAYQLQDVEARLADELGRDPSDMEIADRSGISLKRIAKIRAAMMPANTGRFVDEFGEEFAPASTIPGESRLADAQRELLYHELSPIDQAIMDHTLGLHGRQVIGTSDLAKKLRLTPGAISQRKNKLDRMLEAEMAAIT